MGYHYEEHVLPVGRPVFVLGEATDASGQLVIREPGRTGGPGFIVSVRSEEELARSAERALRWLVSGAIASAAAGAVILLVGLLR